jgi:hypothetical protein
MARVIELGLNRWTAVTADVDAVFVPVNVRQAAVHLDDYHPGPFDHRAVPEIVGAEVEEAVLVHRAGFENDDVNGIEEAPIVECEERCA